MQTTSIYGFPYPDVGTDPPNGAGQQQSLAEAVEATLQQDLTLGGGLTVPGALTVGGIVTFGAVEDTSPGTVAPGFTVVAAVARTLSGLVYVQLTLLSTNAISATSGNLPDTLCYTLDSAYWPAEQIVMPFQTGGVGGGVATVDTDGTVDLRAAWTDIAAGASVVICGTYIQS